jgi:predicted DCC family thiol-disulfide oxidoreductase YuxK
MTRLTQSAVTPRTRRPGFPPVRRLTVLYDPACRLCAFVRDWLVRQRQLVRLDLVPAGSPEAMRRFPGLDHAATSREITVVGDSGQLYRGDSAWVVCLWALADHRALSHTLTTPAGRKLARAAVLAAAKYRESKRQTPVWFPAHASGPPKAGAPGAGAPKAGAPLAGGPLAGAPLAGVPRAPAAPPAQRIPGWTYDKATGWTQSDVDVRPPEPRPPHDGNGGRARAHGGECADGCAAGG